MLSRQETSEGSNPNVSQGTPTQGHVERVFLALREEHAPCEKRGGMKVTHIWLIFKRFQCKKHVQGILNGNGSVYLALQQPAIGPT